VALALIGMTHASPDRAQRWRRLTPWLPVLVPLLVLGSAEAGLRAVGFERETVPVAMRFGYPDAAEIADLFQPDPHLFWRLRPGTTFEAEGPVAINALGFRGPLPREPRPPRSARIAVLGDSVAFGASTAWPEIASTLLQREVLNFGVPGYTVVQGLRQFEREVAPLRPDLVIVAYGWNDHWLARGGLPDTDRRPPPAALARIASFLSRWRVYQALQAVLEKVAAPSPASAPSVPRVPPDVFADTLEALIGRVRGSGARPLVLALPSGHLPGRVPAYLVEGGFVGHGDDAIHDHRRYAGLARDTAARLDVPFLDLQPGFDPSLFGGDGIHPNRAGLERVALRVAVAVAPMLPPIEQAK
jgi:lysophospholipase L1-like esterase